MFLMQVPIFPVFVAQGRAMQLNYRGIARYIQIPRQEP
jgi:hypothetical protein